MSAVRALAAACAVAVLPACGLFRSASTTPTASDALVGKDGKLTELGLQAEVQRMVDSFFADVTQACNALATEVGTQEARISARYWNTGQCISALAIATGPRATANLLNFVVLATVGRMIQERHWQPEYGAADDLLLATYRKYEEGSWKVASQVLNDEQEQTLHEALDNWMEQNPAKKFAAFIRIPTFSELVGTEQQSGSASSSKRVVSSLLSIVNVDPFSGLDPTTREIERSRLFAERVFFYAQRAPIVLSMQVELMTMELLALPKVDSVIQSTQSLSAATKQIGEVAARLPEELAREREQVLQQISRVLDEQRQGIVTDLEKTGPELQSLLTESRTTFEEATKLSDSLQHLVRAVDGFVDEFEEPEGGADGAPPAAANAAPSHPFDIREYGSTARDVTETARQLQQLVTTIDTSVPELQRALDATQARAEQLTNRLFWRGVILVLIAIVGTSIAVWVLRRAKPARG